MRVLLALLLASLCCLGETVLSKAPDTVEVNDFVELTVSTPPLTGNPFIASPLAAELRHESDEPVFVMGFCDSADGSVFRVRFLPTKAGAYTYRITFQTQEGRREWNGFFLATPSHRRGLVRVDPDYPSHFIWAGTGEHYFWNGLTTYALMGWQDEEQIHAIIDRAAKLKVNRLRVSLNGPRVADASRWYEPLQPSEQFHFLFGPWVAAQPGNIHEPGWDVARFDIAFWQKYERLVKYARDHDVVVSVIFFLDGEDAGADPFGKSSAFSEDEKRYYAYAASRLSAYSNVMWDVTNEWHLFRDAWWVERMGEYLKFVDPYKHLASCHGRGEFPWMLSPWANFAMFQLWDEDGGYGPMLKRREAQAATGRSMPQVNEEYGYEDHYPVKWGGNRRPPARSADNRRRLAWEIAMAGCYQTTGERANRGEGNPPATPGGWINGGFDPSMHMLEGYAHMVDFFTSIEYWKLEPATFSPPASGHGHDAPRMLTENGRLYVVYFPQGGTADLTLAQGSYRSRWFNPRSGEWIANSSLNITRAGQHWTTPASPDAGDWVMLLESAR